MPELAQLRITKPGIIGVSRWNSVIDAIQERTITSFQNGAHSRTAGGTTLWARPGASGGAAAASHPFQVLTRPKPESTSITQGKVILGSSLFNSLQPNDKQAITGLDTWFDLLGNDAIWLGIVFNSSGVVTSAAIDSWGQEDDFDVTKAAWSGENGYCEDDEGSPAVHQTSRKLIAYSEADEAGSPILSQVMTRNQLLRNVCIDGRPARYPFDHEGGYPL